MKPTALHTLLLASAVCWCLALTSSAQQPPEGPRVTGHAAGALHLAVRAPSWCAGTARGTVSRDEDGRRTVLWTAELLNNPGFVWVDPHRGWVMTLATTCHCQRPEHALVVYDEHGRAVLDRLEADLVTPADRGRWDRHVVEADDHLDVDGRVLFRSGGVRPVFTEDAVWLDFKNWQRRVLLMRR